MGMYDLIVWGKGKLRFIQLKKRKIRKQERLAIKADPLPDTLEITKEVVFYGRKTKVILGKKRYQS